MKRFLLVLMTLSLMILAACGGGGPEPIVEGAGFSGTTFAPPGGDVANTVVIACFLEANLCNSNSPNTVGVNVTTSGLAATFSLPSVAPGTYHIVALRDANGNGTFGDAGDYQGYYTLDGQSPAPLSPPLGGLNVQMNVLGVAPAPPEPPSGSDLSGTVTAPPGGDVTQTEVIACFLEAGQCNVQSPNTKGAVVGAAGSFTLPGLAAGQYIVVAAKDLDGDNQLTPGDYIGCYGDYPNCDIATPPQTGLNIQLGVEVGAPPDPGTGGTGAISGTIVFPGTLGGAAFGASGAPVPRALLDRAAQFEVRDTPTFAPGTEFVPGEVIVKFKPRAAEKAQLGALSVQGLELQRAQAVGLPRAALYRAEGLDARGTLALVDTLNARADVAYAEPNYLQFITKTPDDEFYPFQWHYEAMNLPAAWDTEDGAAGGVTVAVIDTGSVAHPDLQGALLSGYDFVSDPLNSADGDGYDLDPTDLGGDSSYHGSHVAGTVAASTNNGGGVAGVSWGANVVSVRVLGVTGGGSLADIVNGILWAAGESVPGVPLNANPADVINLSLGGEAPCSSSYQDAFNRARAKGVTVIVAAGNENTDAGFSQPANCDGVITVGATGPLGTRAPYSNYGATVDVMAPGGDKTLTFEVQGETFPAGVLSTVADGAGGYGYTFQQGTSMASPHVAGLVALMLAQEPGLDPDTVLARLQTSALPLSGEACGQPDGCGAGLVDAAGALGGAGSAPPVDSPPPVGSATTYVAALYCLAGCSDFDESLSAIEPVSADTLQVPYRLGDLVAGTYVVAAWQNLDGDEEVDEGEPFGRHLNNLTLAPRRGA